MARRALPMCKPWWTLKYRPYGVLAEVMPLLRVDRDEADSLFETREPISENT